MLLDSLNISTHSSSPSVELFLQTAMSTTETIGTIRTASVVQPIPHGQHGLSSSPSTTGPIWPSSTYTNALTFASLIFIFCLLVFILSLVFLLSFRCVRSNQQNSNANIINVHRSQSPSTNNHIKKEETNNQMVRLSDKTKKKNHITTTDPKRIGIFTNVRIDQGNQDECATTFTTIGQQFGRSRSRASLNSQSSTPISMTATPICAITSLEDDRRHTEEVEQEREMLTLYICSSSSTYLHHHHHRHHREFISTFPPTSLTTNTTTNTCSSLAASIPNSELNPTPESTSSTEQQQQQQRALIMQLMLKHQQQKQASQTPVAQPRPSIISRAGTIGSLMYHSLDNITTTGGIVRSSATITKSTSNKYLQRHLGQQHNLSESISKINEDEKYHNSYSEVIEELKNRFIVGMNV